MLNFALRPFSKTHHDLAITGEVAAHGRRLNVSWHLHDPQNVVRHPGGTTAEREIGLWNHTCFEIFVGSSLRADYLEFNFASNHHWNAFYFEAPGDALVEYTPIHQIQINTIDATLGVGIPLMPFPSEFWHEGQMKVGISSVLELVDGTLQYWALSHPETKPNFHNRHSWPIHL